MRLRTNILAPPDLVTLAARHAVRFREGCYGTKVRPHHRDAVFLTPPDHFDSNGRVRSGSCRIDVWGDPSGRVTVHAVYYPKEDST